jgi:hypothetical protein
VVALPSAIVFKTSCQHIRPHKKCSRTVNVAFSILSAYALRFMCLNIINEDNKSAVGLAKPLPRKYECATMSDARYIPSITYRQYPALTRVQPQKWTHPDIRKSKFHDRNMPLAFPMLPDGVSPSPPIKPAHMSERISPYRLGITMTRSPNGLGFCVIFCSIREQCNK